MFNKKQTGTSLFPEEAGSLSPREAADWSRILRREYESHVDQRDIADATAEEAFDAADEQNTADAFKKAHEIASRVAPDIYLGKLGMKVSLKDGKELAEIHGEALYDAAVAEAALDSVEINK